LDFSLGKEKSNKRNQQELQSGSEFRFVICCRHQNPLDFDGKDCCFYASENDCSCLSVYGFNVAQYRF